MEIENYDELNLLFWFYREYRRRLTHTTKKKTEFLIFGMDISVVVIIFHTYHIRPWLKNTTMDGWFLFILLLLFIYLFIFIFIFNSNFNNTQVFYFSSQFFFILFFFCWYAKSCERASKQKKKESFSSNFQCEKNFYIFLYILQLKN